MSFSSKNPILQVALDFADLPRALKTAEEAVRGGADWIEAGTPLIKSEGLNAVRALRRAFPRRRIVADMKVLDTGAFEVEMAAKAGADVVVLLGLADDSTVREGVEAAARFGSEVMVDLLGVEDMVGRAVVLEGLGVHYICVHVGIDQQMRGVKPLEVLSAVAEAVSVPVAVAGGINSENAPMAVERGASIVVVGGAITKAEDAAGAARAIKEAMVTRKPSATRLFKKAVREEDICQVFREVSTANISDAMQRRGEMAGIMPITAGVKAVGRALTVRTYPGDWAKPVEAIDLAQAGDVIVVEAGGVGKAVWGELATWSCVKRGVGGVVIDGAIRDVDVIRELGFPAFAKAVTPTAGDPKGLGEINVEVVCGGVKVRPGDWIVADDSGVVVVPRQLAVEVANRSRDVMEKENRIREEIKRGSTLGKVLSLRKWEKIIG